MSLIIDTFYKIYNKLNRNTFIQALKQSFTMLLPILFIGSFALLLQSFPIGFIREFIQTCFNGLINKVLSLIYIITFGFSSIYLLIILTYKYFNILSKRNNLTIYACLNSLVCYFILLGPSVFYEGNRIFNYTDMNNIFVSLSTALVATILFNYITEFIAVRKKKISFTSNFSTAVNIIIPISMCALIYILYSIFVYLVSGYNVNDFISNSIVYPFVTIGNTYFGGLLITFVSSVLFFFGIHGRSVFQDVYESVFVTGNGIASNALFDCFTLIGGVGSTLCLVIALLLFSNGRRRKKIAKASLLPMAFNINEMMIFGLPIIFNPIYIIPFVLVPLINYSIGYFSIYIGLIPQLEATFQWTTPILFNSYFGSSSIICVLIQLLCLIIGTIIYIPFVKLDNHILTKASGQMNTELKNYLIECENKVIEPQLFGLNNHLVSHAESILISLENSIRNGQIELFYQPLVKDDKIVSVEALLRYKYKCKEYLFPPLVILIAKEKGLFNSLSKEIIKKAVKDFKEMLIINPNLKLSVNLDLDILHDNEFFTWMINYIETSNIPKFHFGVEVTENSKYQAKSNLNNLFKILHNYGINVYMDDFSMGNTSIRFLQDTLFDYVKLDGSLVKNLDNDRAQNIIDSIIKLGSSLNFEVIAEFVETEEQKEKLKNMGCFIYQGYLYYKAMPYDDVIKILKNNR